MSIVGLEDLPRILSPGQRLLGLDLGEKTIGLALTDTLLTVASPLTPVGLTPFGTTSGFQSERQAAFLQMNLPCRSTLSEYSVRPWRLTRIVLPSALFFAVITTRVLPAPLALTA